MNRIRCILGAVMPALPKRFMRTVKSGAAVFCLGIFLLVQLMAAVPCFHAWLHHDASEADHECAATLLLSGQVHASNADVNVARPAPVLISQSPDRQVHFDSTDIRWLPSRGPPA